MELWEKTVESETLFEGKIVTLKLDKAQLVNGRIARREVVTELPAGKLEKGEDHRPAALRELEEEVGVTCGKLTYLGCLYLSPGFSTEVLHMYLAQDLKQGACHPDDDEFLDVARVPFSRLVEQVMAGEIVDAKTVALVLKVKQLLGL